jgi:hypothetical protein
MKTVLVSGAIANKLGSGGDVWVRLQWALGLQQLGLGVIVVEQIDSAVCGDGASLQSSPHLAYFREVTTRFGLSGSAALICPDTDEVVGMDRQLLLERARSADGLINISGHLTWAPLFDHLQRKVFLDIDPGYTQYWHAAGLAAARLAGHDFYYTIGQNIGGPDCPIPVGNLRWRTTRPVVALDHWPLVAPAQLDRFTTVASWRGAYGRIEHGGRAFGLKAHELRKFAALPRHSRHRFEIALNIHPADAADRQLLLANGWRLVCPQEAAGCPERFRRYIQSSGAELSVAQGIYVETNSGWFSDRSAAYLATGRPVLVQDTGLGRHLPLGDGLLTFRTLDEAVEGAERIARDYCHHCQAARALAERYFAADRVLARLLEEIGVTV